MTAPAPDHQRGDSDHNAFRLAHLRVGMPTSDQVGPGDHERRLRELLGPFVAWLATRDLDESRRRRHRDAPDQCPATYPTLAAATAAAVGPATGAPGRVRSGSDRTP